MQRKSKDHKEYYLNNSEYTDWLENQDETIFEKYVDTVKKNFKKNGKFLDVGCGTGIAQQLIGKKSNTYGIEISQTSIDICKKKGLNCQIYNGDKIPFKNSYFTVVGSFNVLEHTNNPEKFLDENLRVLKKEGYLIIACPNFLSISNNYHYHTRGSKQKISNIITTGKYVLSSARFEKMNAIKKEKFEADDDAVNITNPISILKWGRKKKLKKIYWSSQWYYRGGIANILDKTPSKLFLGSAFIVFKK